jgi:hypothetical protein
MSPTLPADEWLAGHIGPPIVPIGDWRAVWMIHQLRTEGGCPAPEG